jgi:hypothetical protein
MTAALAWPIAVVAVSWLLRGPIKSLVPLLRTLRYGDFEAELSLEKEVRVLEAELESEHSPVSVSLAEGSTHQAEDFEREDAQSHVPTPEDKTERITLEEQTLPVPESVRRQKHSSEAALSLYKTWNTRFRGFDQYADRVAHLAPASVFGEGSGRINEAVRQVYRVSGGTKTVGDAKAFTPDLVGRGVISERLGKSILDAMKLASRAYRQTLRGEEIEPEQALSYGFSTEAILDQLLASALAWVNEHGKD